MVNALSARQTPTLEAFKSFSLDIAPAARAVLMARVFAQMERERVDAYIKPIFDSYKFTVSAKFSRHETGEVITSPKDLYLVEDLEDPLVLAFYADCDDAHRANGFTGPKGHCPALKAESLLMATEQALIDLAKPMFGIEHVYGEDRTKYLELLIGAALKAEQDSK